MRPRQPCNRAARRGATVVAVDTSATAIKRIQAAALAETLRIEAICADVESFCVPGRFDTVVAIGLLMFFQRERALKLLTKIQDYVGNEGLAIVNVLIEGTTYMGMFDPENYYLFGRNQLGERFRVWDILLSRHDSFEAPGSTTKEFATIIARKHG